MSDSGDATEQRSHIFRLLRDFDTAMLVTHTAPDGLRARPMAIAAVEDEGVVWFISSADTAKVHEIETDTRVHLICQREPSVYLSLGGFATVVSDRRKLAELWQEKFRTWFPAGADDPDAVLIDVKLSSGEFWDNKSLRNLKAFFSGSDEHGFVRL